MLALLLVVVSIVLFILEALRVPEPPRVSLGWLGLAAFAAAALCDRLGAP